MDDSIQEYEILIPKHAELSNDFDKTLYPNLKAEVLEHQISIEFIAKRAGIDKERIIAAFEQSQKLQTAEINKLCKVLLPHGEPFKGYATDKNMRFATMKGAHPLIEKVEKLKECKFAEQIADDDDETKNAYLKLLFVVDALQSGKATTYAAFAEQCWNVELFTKMIKH